MAEFLSLPYTRPRRVLYNVFKTFCHFSSSPKKKKTPKDHFERCMFHAFMYARIIIKYGYIYVLVPLIIFFGILLKEFT